jgi:hypothetical protein
MILKLPLFIISWILFIALDLSLLLIGWVLVPIAAACRAYEMTDLNVSKPGDGPIYHFTWRFMWLWDNKIDGIANINYKKCSSLFWQILYWYNRNPVSNLRFVKYLSFKISPEKINFIGSANCIPESIAKRPHWFLCWHGPYSCFYWRGASREFLIGWKAYPKDIYGLNENSYRLESTGFGSQFKRI